MLEQAALRHRPAGRSAPGVSRQRASGLRRHVPVPEQGASISTHVGAAVPVGQRLALAARVRAAGSRRSSRRRARRAAAAATAGRDRCRWRGCVPWFAIAAASASVLPPAPAHRSITVMPGCGLGGERHHLAARVLHLDQPVAECRAGFDRRCRTAGAARRAGRRSARRRRSANSVDASPPFSAIDAQVERRALDQRGGFGRVDVRTPGSACRASAGAVPGLGRGGLVVRRSARGPCAEPSNVAAIAASLARQRRRIAARPLVGHARRRGGSRHRPVRAPRGDPSIRHSGASAK